MPNAPKKEAEIEFRPDGWERFEKAIDAAVKGGPKHKPEPKPAPKKEKPGR
jgi:hypothetical protein